MESGLVFNLQKYSLQDGPGIRTTVFLKGCPLNCAWCHNPESWSLKPGLSVLETRCLHCGECRAACTGSGIPEPPPGEPPGVASFCTLCNACVEACPSGARQQVGQPMTSAQVLDEVARDLIFYDESGGGVTFSGGEPLLQSDFLLDLLRGCRARHIHSAVDTSGFASSQLILRVAELTDLFLYDVKVMDPARHKAATGVSNVIILDNLRRLSRSGARLWIRVPVIPGINDDAENFHALGRFLDNLPGVERVDLLPYHRTGVSKFKRMGEVCHFSARPPTPAEVKPLADILIALKLPVFTLV
jgi:pyruvate formate lyase activating enzyme